MLPKTAYVLVTDQMVGSVAHGYVPIQLDTQMPDLTSQVYVFGR
jgi:hypothetical protein